VFKQELAHLDSRNAVIWKKGKGQRRLVVFADPYCGYCKRLEQELQKLDNLTVYTFMVPVISEDSPAKIRDIWCSPDRITAWRKWMLDNVSPARAMGQCEAPLKSNLQAYDHFQVHGTPGIFFEDGSRSPGLLSAEEIEQRLSGIDDSSKH
jgi:thiol:disulfide interchange protein DsbC